MPGTTSLEIHQYGRQLLPQKKSEEALAVFKYNAERNGDNWPEHVGLALEHAKRALVKALSSGQAIN